MSLVVKINVKWHLQQAVTFTKITKLKAKRNLSLTTFLPYNISPWFWFLPYISGQKYQARHFSLLYKTVEFLLYMKSCRINLFIGLSLDIPPRVNWVKYYKILMKIAMAPSCGNLLSKFTSRVTQKSLKCPKNLFRLFLHAWNVNMLLSIMN